MFPTTSPTWIPPLGVLWFCFVSLRSSPQWTEDLAICIDRALDKAVWLYVAMYGYITKTWYVYVRCICLCESTNMDRGWTNVKTNVAEVDLH